MEDQLFSPGNQEHAAGVKYVVWYTLEFHNETTYRDKCIIVDFKKFTEHKTWVLSGEPGHNLDLPAEYGIVRKRKYVKGSNNDLRTDVTRDEMTKLQKDFHNQLWGGAKMGDTDVFNNLLKMFLAKIYDERNTAEGEPYKCQTELKDGSPETAEEILAKVNGVYQDALRHYFKYGDETILLNTINKERFKPEKVAYVMERLEGISIIENKFEDDVLGVFFEAIVRTGFKQEKGQFFTHSNIVRFAKKVANAAKELLNARSVLRLPGDIINEILCEEFGYPLKEYQERSRLHQFSTKFSKMATGFMLRQSLPS